MEEQILQMNPIQLSTHNKILQALRIQSKLSITMIEKISITIQKYFQMKQNYEKLQIQADKLLQFNTKLIEVVWLFQDHQKKILDRMYKLEQINIKYMKDFCMMKNKDFKIQQYRPMQPIFNNFKISQWKFETKLKIQQKIEPQYSQKFFQLFKKYLIKKDTKFEEILQKAINQQKQKISLENKKAQDNRFQNQKLNILIDIRRKFCNYNLQVDKVSKDNMFDLYAQRKQLYEQYYQIDSYSSNNGVQVNNQNHNQNLIEEEDENFLTEVLKINLKIQQLKQDQFSNFLKTYKNTNKLINRQKIKKLNRLTQVYQNMVQEHKDYEDQIKKLKRQTEQLYQQNCSLKSVLRQKQNQLYLKSIKSNRGQLKRQNSLQHNFTLMNDQSLAEQIKKLKNINKQLNQNLSTTRQKLETVTQELNQLKINNQSSQINIETPVIKMDIRTFSIPIPVLLFYEIYIKIQSKAIQLIKNKLKQYQINIKQNQESQSLIEILLDTIMYQKKTMLATINKLQLNVEGLSQENQQLKVQQDKLIKQLEIEIAKIKDLSMEQEFLENAKETINMMERQRNLLCELHQKAVERIASSENMVCQAMDTVMETAFGGAEEALKSIQASLVQLKRLLETGKAKSGCNIDLQRVNSIDGKKDQSKSNNKKKKQQPFFQKNIQNQKTGNHKNQQQSVVDKNNYKINIKRPIQSNNPQKNSIINYVTNQQEQNSKIKDKDKDNTIQKNISQNQKKDNNKINPHQNQNQDNEEMRKLNQSFCSQFSQIDGKNIKKQSIAEQFASNFDEGNQMNQQNQLNNCQDQNFKRLKQKKESKKKKKDQLQIQKNSIVDFNYSQLTNNQQKKKHIHKLDISGEIGVSVFPSPLLENSLSHRQPSALTEQYVRTIQQKYKFLKNKLLEKNQQEDQNWYERYKEMELSLRNAQKVNKKNQLQYQKFIQDLQEDVTCSTDLKMKDQIFYLERRIKELQGTIQEQKRQFQTQIKFQLLESEKIANQILQSFRSEKDSYFQN